MKAFQRALFVSSSLSPLTVECTERDIIATFKYPITLQQRYFAGRNHLVLIIMGIAEAKV